MRIENHRLVDTDPNDGIRVEFIPDETAGPLVPELIVIHYAVTESARATAHVLNEREYCSCHLTIDKTGHVIQQVPFDRVAWHAGVSSYKGREKVSRFSIGIEISNPGPLLIGPDGRFRTVYGKVWEGGVVAALHSNARAPAGWRHWAEYSDTEIDLTAHLCELLRQAYPTIRDIVGHDEIAPGRKFDPGPAFDMEWLRETIFPGRSTRAELDTLPDNDAPTDPAPPPESQA